MRRVALGLAASALAACYEPSLAPCTITCDPADGGDACPGDQVCRDGLCGDPDATCPTATVAVHAIAAGAAHVCAITDSGANVYCWGDNSHGQLAQPASVRDSDPMPIDLPGDIDPGLWRAIAAGRYHTCGIYQDNAPPMTARVLCWGDNASGQLGRNGTMSPPFYGPNLGPGQPVAIAAGDAHTCAVVETDGAQQILCWGANEFLQLGYPTAPVPQSADANPVALPTAFASARWHAIDGGAGHTCAVTTQGQLACWGDNNAGQLGRAGDAAPAAVDGAYNEVTAAADHTCAVARNGTLECWGNAAHGLGFTTDEMDILTPHALEGLGADPGWTAIETAAQATCGIRAGVTYCWGDGYPQNGVGTLTRGQLVPADPVTSLAADASGLALTDISACAARATGDRDIACWGDSLHGELGDGTRTIVRAPVEIMPGDSGLPWRKVVAGRYHTCGILDDGINASIACWGRNASGEVPANMPDYTVTPVELVTDDLRDLDVAVGEARTCAVYTEPPTDATAYCWGDDALAGADIPLTGIGAAPVIAADGGFTCVMSTTTPSTPQCWGRPKTGKAVTAPVTSTFSSFAPFLGGSVRWGFESGCAISVAQNRVVCFGYESREELGNGPGGSGLGWDQTVPTSLQSTSPLSHGTGQTRCGVNISNDILCWGDNAHQQAVAGMSDPTIDMPTTALTATMGVRDLSTGGTHTCAILGSAGAVLSCWGETEMGQRTGATLPDPAPIDAPVASPAVTGYLGVSAGGEHTCAIDAMSRLFCWGRNTYGQIGNGASARPVAGPVTIQ